MRIPRGKIRARDAAVLAAIRSCSSAGAQDPSEATGPDFNRGHRNVATETAPPGVLRDRGMPAQRSSTAGLWAALFVSNSKTIPCSYRLASLHDGANSAPRRAVSSTTKSVAEDPIHLIVQSLMLAE